MAGVCVSGRGELQLSHPEAALRPDVQDGENRFVQDGVAHRLGAVGVGGHLRISSVWSFIRSSFFCFSKTASRFVNVSTGPELVGRSWCRWLFRRCDRGSAAASGSAPDDRNNQEFTFSLGH